MTSQWLPRIVVQWPEVFPHLADSYLSGAKYVFPGAVFFCLSDLFALARGAGLLPPVLVGGHGDAGRYASQSLPPARSVERRSVLWPSRVSGKAARKSSARNRRRCGRVPVRR